MGPTPGSPVSPHPGRRAPGLSYSSGAGQEARPTRLGSLLVSLTQPTFCKYLDLNTALTTCPLQIESGCLEMPFQLEETVHAESFMLLCASCHPFIQS